MKEKKNLSKKSIIMNKNTNIILLILAIVLIVGIVCGSIIINKTINKNENSGESDPYIINDLPDNSKN